MKISGERRQAVYSAIHEQVMRLRIKLQQEHKLSSEIDSTIAQTVSPIYRDVKTALNIEDE